jgi:hypothetical protein
MMKSIMAIATVVLLAAPVAMAQQRSAGVCVADISKMCWSSARRGAGLGTALKHTRQNFPTRVGKAGAGRRDQQSLRG